MKMNNRRIGSPLRGLLTLGSVLFGLWPGLSQAMEGHINGRLSVLPVYRITVTTGGEHMREEGRLHALHQSGSFDGLRRSLGFQTGFPSALTNRPLVSVAEWEAWTRLGPDALRNYRLGSPAASIAGVTYRPVEVDQEDIDFLTGIPVAVSTRAYVGAQAQRAVAGFTVEGGPALVLIRGIGPTLSQFQVPGSLADPFLTLFKAQTPFRYNDNWGDHSDADLIAALTKAVGLFPLHRDSRDAVILAELEAGTYTAMLEGMANTTGVGLIEVYIVRGSVLSPRGA